MRLRDPESPPVWHLKHHPIPLLLQRSGRISTIGVFISVIVVLLCSTVALSSVIQLDQPSNFRSSASDRTLAVKTNAIHAFNATQIQCNGNIYRSDLVEWSCRGAYRTMGYDRRLFSFGDRDLSEGWDLGLPYRWISGVHPDCCLSTAISFELLAPSQKKGQDQVLT